MTDIFISYARSTATQAQAVAQALRGAGHRVWLDDELPVHRSFSDVLEERLKAAKAVVVLWSAEAVKSEWVQSEADRAREDGKLVQVSIDGARLPMPFDRIQCADLAGWTGDVNAPGWLKVLASIGDLSGAASPASGLMATEPPPLPSKPSIAVLPFANLSGDSEQDYFADGMVEEITRVLSRFKSIFVIGAGSGLSFKGKSITSQDAARALGVRYVLEGSVRRAGGRVRIAVNLIDGLDGTQIWADRFEDTLEDIFALQDKVALSVAGVIEPAVREAEIRRASARPTDNMGSYDLCLRAQSLFRSVARADVFATLDLLNRAIGLDPSYGLALARAAHCHAFIIVYGWSDDPDSHGAQAKTLIQRALRVAADDAEVLGALAMTMQMIRQDLDTAVALANRAAVLNPGSSYTWMVNGLMRLHSGAPDIAFEYWETSLRLDPLSPSRPVLLGLQGLALFAQGRFAEAIPLMKQSAHLRPDWPLSHAVLAASHGHLGDKMAARAAIERHRVLTPLDVRDWAASWRPELRKLILDGIDLAEAAEPLPDSHAADPR